MCCCRDKLDRNSYRVNSQLLTYLCIILVAWLGQPTTSKQIKKQVKIWEFTEAKCVFVGRYGTTLSRAECTAAHKIDWKNDQDRQSFGNMRVSLIGLFEKGHRKATDLIDVSDPLIIDKISAQVVLNYTLQLLSDGTQTFDVMIPEPNRLVYFYLCDNHHSVASAYKSKLEVSREQARPDLHGSGLNLAIDLDLVDSSARHHSVEEEHTFVISAVFFVAFVVLFVLTLRRIIILLRADERGDEPLQVLCCVLGILTTCAACKMAGFWLYSAGNRTVSAYFELVHRVLFMAGDGLLCVFLILLSKGWGVGADEDLLDRGLEFIIGFLLVVARYTWCLIGYFVEAEQDELFHLYDGWTGKLEILNLFAFYIWFQISLKKEAALKSEKLTQLGKILNISSYLLYLLRPMLVVLFISLSLPEQQHALSLITTYASSYLSCALFCWTILPKNGVYMKVSTSNQPELELATNTKIN
jgi:Rhodopsin-like GPCR transmembrane domain